MKVSRESLRGRFLLHSRPQCVVSLAVYYVYSQYFRFDCQCLAPGHGGRSCDIAQLTATAPLWDKAMQVPATLLARRPVTCIDDLSNNTTQCLQLTGRLQIVL